MEEARMAYKPNDFFVGVIDFFGILVPGAVLLFLHGESLAKPLGLGSSQEQTILWAAFLLGSYVLGHFLLGLGVPSNSLLRLYRSEKEDDFYIEAKKMITLPSGREENRTDAFYRAYSFIRLNSPAALAEIERQMADYKLFRSLMLVLALDLVLVASSGAAHWPRLVFSGALFILAAWRFLFLLDWTYRITFEYRTLLGSSRSVHPEKSRPA
jgi:hypothetical protein